MEDRKVVFYLTSGAVYTVVMPVDQLEIALKNIYKNRRVTRVLAAGKAFILMPNSVVAIEVEG